MEEIDLSLPKKHIKDIIKIATKGNFLVNKEVTESINIAAISFILFLSHNAQIVAKKDNKKLIMPNHVLEALNNINMNEYVELIKDIKNKNNENKRVKAASISHSVEEQVHDENEINTELE